ncbi:ABC transporter permease [Neogemmobacter tilapiae]|uniref:ABC transporter membrane protein n=1 Tax=Neogemmobacter tilapiae TaxID=875041 RepID=A0A918WNB1_9RHOB|nr:ABC transporter permease subunit [Gemmobacter tilapiae]GHC61112.1 ABC transporter membrane protein [Gemmobacter tilapiae]
MKRLVPLSGAAVSLLLILPLLPLIFRSIAHGWRFPDLWPQQFSLRAWAFAFSSGAGTGPALAETVIIALMVALISVVVALPPAQLIGQHNFRGKGLLLALIALPLLLPPFAALMGLHGLFARLHLTGTRTGVILAHLIPALPYAIFILAALFARLDRGYVAQARSLGASPWQAFVRVTLPMIRPGLMLAFALTFLVSWGQYALTLMIGGGRVETLPLLLFSTLSAGRNDLTGALGLIYILPGLIILALTVRK